MGRWGCQFGPRENRPIRWRIFAVKLLPVKVFLWNEILTMKQRLPQIEMSQKKNIPFTLF